MYSDILRSKRTLGWRTVLIVPELLNEVDSLEDTAAQREATQALRRKRARVDLQLRRVQLERLNLLQDLEAAEKAAADGGVSDDALEALAALDAQHTELEESQRALSVALADGLQQSHAAFHPQWGQLFKAGHQNSRWAQQVQDYACLYTSHATNFLYASGNTTFRTLSDLMPHDRAVDAPMEADA